jgi:hypothetical protein
MSLEKEKCLIQKADKFYVICNIKVNRSTVSMGDTPALTLPWMKLE